MKSTEKNNITVHTIVQAPLNFVWNCWNSPDAIVKWNNPSEDWHTTKAENELKVGGRFNYRMEARDGSFGFDFWGIYDTLKPNELIENTLGDDRKVRVAFSEKGNTTMVEETFETESQNPIEMQKHGWQTILDNFKNYTEEKYKSE